MPRSMADPHYVYTPWPEERRRRASEKTKAWWAEKRGKPEPNWLDLTKRSTSQVSELMAALAELIDIYSDNVQRAEERYQKEREFLATLMTEYTRMAHFIARKGAVALEEQSERAGA